VSRLRAGLGAGCPGLQAAEQDQDLVGDMLEQWSASSPEVCCEACAKKKDCQGFAFSEDRCYLKANVTGTVPKPGCIARMKEGVPAEVSTPSPAPHQCAAEGAQADDVFDGAQMEAVDVFFCRDALSRKATRVSRGAVDVDLIGKLLERCLAASAEACCAACAQKPQCQGFVFIANQCLLKGDIKSIFKHKGFTAGVKFAGGGGRRLGSSPLLV